MTWNRDNKHEALAAALEDHLGRLREEARAAYASIYEECDRGRTLEGFMGTFSDPYADTFVQVVREGGSKRVELVYEGAGYQYLSPEADYPRMAGQNSHAFIVIAQEHGFNAEPINGWSLGFWME